MLTIAPLRSEEYHESEKENYYNESDSANSMYLGSGAKELIIYNDKIHDGDLKAFINGYHPINKDKLFDKPKHIEKPQISPKEKKIFFQNLSKIWDGNDIYLSKCVKQALKHKEVIKGDVKHELTDKEKQSINKKYLIQAEENFGTDACLSVPKDFTLIYNFDKEMHVELHKVYVNAIKKTTEKMEEFLYARVRKSPEEQKEILNHFVRNWDGDYKTFTQARIKSYNDFVNGVPVDLSKPARDISNEEKKKLFDGIPRDKIKIKPIFLTYLHKTARPVEDKRPDPQEHAHVLFLKKGLDENGNWVGIENNDLVKNQKYIGTYFRNELAKGLRELGFEIQKINETFIDEEQKSIVVDSWKIKGITNEQRDNFSNRSIQIIDTVGKEASTMKKKAASLELRQSKVSYDGRELFTIWRNEADNLNLTQDYIRSLRNNKPKIRLATEAKIIKDSMYKGKINEKKLKLRLKEDEQYSGRNAEKEFARYIKNGFIEKVDNKNFAPKIDVKNADVINKKAIQVINKFQSQNVEAFKELIAISQDKDLLGAIKDMRAKLNIGGAISLKERLGRLQNQLLDNELSEEEKAKIQAEITQLGYQIKAQEEEEINKNNQMSV